MRNNLIRASLFAMALLSVAAFGQTVPLTQDSYAVPGNPINYGSATTINVGGPANAQALVQFDLSTLPAGTAANVAKATLALFVNKVGATGMVNISVASGAWTEAGLNGTNAPVPAAAVASGVAISGASEYLYVDATAAVRSWLSGTTNSGFIITPAGGGVNIAFDSKESATTSHPAAFTIILTNTGPAGAMGATGPTGPISTVGGPAGPTGPASATGATGTAPAIAFEINVAFSGAVSNYYAPVPNGANPGEGAPVFPDSETVVPRACTTGQLYVGAVVTAATPLDFASATITLLHGSGANAPGLTRLACSTIRRTCSVRPEAVAIPLILSVSRLETRCPWRW